MIINKIINIGIRSHLSSAEVKKIKVLNFIIIMGLVVSLIFIVIDAFFTFGGIDKVVILTVGMGCLLFCLYLQYSHRYFSARLLLFFFTAGLFFIQTNVTFRGFYGEYNYLLLPLFSVFFFEQKWIHYASLVLAVGLFYIPNMIWEIYPEQYFGYANVAALMIGIFIQINYFKNLNLKSEKAILAQKELSVGLLEQKLLLSQLNPHFIFNSLQAIQNHLTSQNSKEAVIKLAKFGKLMRQTLEYSRVEYLLLVDEIMMLETYLSTYQLMADKKVTYRVSYSEDIDQLQTEIPPMFVQPFVENALEHGFREMDGGHISVHFEKQRTSVMITIEDNGQGLGKTETNHQSLATMITQERLQLFEMKYNQEFVFSIIDTGQGVRVSMQVPFRISS